MTSIPDGQGEAMKFLTACASGMFATMLTPAAAAHTPTMESQEDRVPITIYWVKSKPRPDGLMVTGKVRLRTGSSTPPAAHLHASVTLADGTAVLGKARWRTPLTRRHRSSDFGVFVRLPSDEPASNLRVWYHDDRDD